MASWSTPSLRTRRCLIRSVCTAMNPQLRQLLDQCHQSQLHQLPLRSPASQIHVRDDIVQQDLASDTLLIINTNPATVPRGLRIDQVSQQTSAETWQQLAHVQQVPVLSPWNPSLDSLTSTHKPGCTQEHYRQVVQGILTGKVVSCSLTPHDCASHDMNHT